jgi:protein-disulfide isomerase
MTRKRGIGIVVSAALLLGAAVSSFAAVEAQVLKVIPLDETPVATAVTADGQTVYVLTDKALHIYSPAGILRDRLALSEPADSISLPPRGNIVILGNSAAKTVRFVNIEIVRQIDTAGAPSLGPDNAPVTIVFFTDFQCPYCVGLSQVMEKVVERYPTEVKLVYKSFPLSSHDFARKAAVAAMAADAQGLFWPMHDRLFAALGKLSDDEIGSAAKDVELDIAAFSAAVADKATAARVDADFKQGEALGVRGTPTTFLNGRLYNGPRTLEGFVAAIDALLPKKEAK